MTAQIPETLHCDGQKWMMCTEPLESFLALEEVKIEPFGMSTSLWRGYIGEWEIDTDRLYLIGIAGESEGERLSIETLFPAGGGRVFAQWFTGTIRASHGERLKNVRGGYGSLYERDLLVEVESGEVRNRRVRVNGKASPPSTEEREISTQEMLAAFLDES